ncbi:MAG: hypothetical protein JXL80_00420, partial [Planctomycetes bacterium]|nr:hypothetical protein [Planctomycetota bacterium]
MTRHVPNDAARGLARAVILGWHPSGMPRLLSHPSALSVLMTSVSVMACVALVMSVPVLILASTMRFGVVDMSV